MYNDLIDPVDVKWVDFEGITRTAEKLASNQNHKFESFFGHEWVLQAGTIKRFFTLGEGLVKNEGVTVRVSQLNAIKPTNDRPSNNRPSNDIPLYNRPSNDRPSNNRPSNNRPSDDIPSYNRPINNRPIYPKYPKNENPYTSPCKNKTV